VRPLSLEVIKAKTKYGCFTGEIQNALQRINEGEFWHVTEFIMSMEMCLDVERYGFHHIQ
jgi:hypothetical protein